ncbi:MAG: hypothetical protein MJ188_01630 [Treponema sp.]|nr:hypothetical protein [Treponema sp.]
MKKLTWTWKKIVSLIAGFLGIGTLVSCYGMPFDPESYNPEYFIKGTVVGDTDNDGKTEPVQGIVVTAEHNSYRAYTDEKGKFVLYLNESYYDAGHSHANITFTDEDHLENGWFDPTYSTNVKFGDMGIVELKPHTPVANDD